MVSFHSLPAAPTFPLFPLPHQSSGSDGGDLTVVPTDYRIGGILLGVALFLGPGLHLWTQFLLHGFLGGFLTFQASRLRFRFSKEAIDLVFIEPFAPDEAALVAAPGSSGDNKLQGGGENKWALSSVTNWEFWWPGFPVLVYFKEKQTRPEGARSRPRAHPRTRAPMHSRRHKRGSRSLRPPNADSHPRIPPAALCCAQASRTSSQSS